MCVEALHGSVDKPSQSTPQCAAVAGTDLPGLLHEAPHPHRQRNQLPHPQPLVMTPEKKKIPIIGENFSVTYKKKCTYMKKKFPIMRENFSVT